MGRDVGDVEQLEKMLESETAKSQSPSSDDFTLLFHLHLLD